MTSAVAWPGLREHVHNFGMRIPCNHIAGGFLNGLTGPRSSHWPTNRNVPLGLLKGSTCFNQQLRYFHVAMQARDEKGRSSLDVCLRH